jgi:aarF domain-containing kinase
MCTYMSKLHSDVKAHRLSATKRIIQNAFDGRSFDTIWEEFDEHPLGIGAIAQVPLPPTPAVYLT